MPAPSPGDIILTLDSNGAQCSAVVFAVDTSSINVMRATMSYGTPTWSPATGLTEVANPGSLVAGTWCARP